MNASRKPGVSLAQVSPNSLLGSMLLPSKNSFHVAMATMSGACRRALAQLRSYVPVPLCSAGITKPLTGRFTVSSYAGAMPTTP